MLGVSVCFLLNLVSDCVLHAYVFMWNYFVVYTNILVLFKDWFELTQQDKHAEWWLDSIEWPNKIAKVHDLML